MDGGQIGLLLAIVFLIVFSGFFSASEMAYTSVNKIRLLNMEQNGNKRAGKVLRETENFDKILSTILVGNNIVNITASSLATLLFTSLILNASLAATVSTLVLTVVVLIFGEITPKLFAKEKPEACAMAFYPLLKFFMYALLPINFIFSGWKWLLRKMFKFEKTSSVTEDELLTIVETAESEGEIAEHESQLIRSAIEFEDLDVKDVMIPRVNVIAVEENAEMESIYKSFTENGFSRMPVYSETIDAVVGVIHEKDFYALLHDGGKSVKSIIQPSVCVSSSMKISTVLRMLQKAKIHMAIVVDEFGGTEGIVTLEDILEELVGEIYDEHDEIEILFRPIDDKNFIVSGDENVEEMFEKLELTSPEDISATTVSGFVIELMDKIPEVGEVLNLEKLTIEVTKASAKHVQEVKVTLVDEEQEEEE
ncbi:MAG: HlyC/CorC family transporter [Clostridia bacterium]|nr:HlyC/CorC family transporter [Clostridia bacterium]MBR7141265.1 HlyC/CorC family transporter [Clostridia bacterium]